MTEKTRKPKKFVLRRLAVAAAVMALAVALAMGANAASGGELMGTVLNYVKSFTVDGSKIDMYEGKIDGQTVYFSVDKQEMDGEGGDVTVKIDDSENDGKTHYTITEYNGEDSTILESGDTEDFTVKVSPDTEGPSAPEE